MARRLMRFRCLVRDVAAATKFLAGSQGAVAVLNYDDVTLLATGVTIANISGVQQITFVITTDQVFSRTVDVGQTAFISFPIALAITLPINIRGLPSIVIVGYVSHGIGTE